ncbi:S8 family serine peptidase [Caldalkalibacillus mannanilyticus]|uniref:S8 family serine peptidase n=1 Tax=Caldalkalibacillus mannanilyticus TaxID=1418 RepID=UPI00046AF54E|nr:S8 family serine peptidase [Caldalkalibacillus mannanilyticus]
MKKWFSFVLIATLILSMFTGFSFANESTLSSELKNADFVEGQLIFSVEADASFSLASTGDVTMQATTLKDKGFAIVDSLLAEGDDFSVQAFSNDFQAEVIENMGLVYLVEYSHKEYKSIEEAKKYLTHVLQDLGYKVRYVSENYMMEAYEVLTSLDQVTDEITTSEIGMEMHNNQRWHYEMIKAPQAWTINQGSSNVKVAVLDTGIDHNHVDLRNFVNTGLGRTFVGGTTMDVQGHGTHVAGTIASYGSVSGVMKNATLIPVKVLGDDGRGSTYGVQQGVLYASSIGSDVINMSLGGGGYNQGMDEACATAVARGTIVVAASGNDSRGTISYPAAYSSVIAVGSVTSNRTRSSFSNYGTGLEVMAPGSNIYSTFPNNQYRTYSGTSMATPHVAGVAGLIRSVNPSISVNDARNILRNTAQNAGSFNEYGYGIVDAHAAVLAAGGNNEDPNTTTTTATTNKSSYTRGENVTLSATVKDHNNQALQGATVQFTITRPNGTTLSGSATTNASGVASWTVSTSFYTAIGTYQVQATSSKSGYSGSSGTTSFSVR